MGNIIRRVRGPRGVDQAVRARLLEAGIPDFLIMSREERAVAWRDRPVTSVHVGGTERVDWHKPKGMSWEEWDARCAREQEEKRARTKERITVVRERYGGHAAASGAAAARAARAAHKRELVRALLARPGGCTTADVLGVLGWPAVSMPAMARQLGVEIRRVKDGGVTRYFAGGNP